MIQLTGDDTSGTCAVTTSCVWNNAGGSDPGCNGDFGVCASGSYANDGTNLTFAGSGAIYH
ncbi:MAG: hypothetical protein ACXWQE_08165 [Bdellovibrionales bacterium]